MSSQISFRIITNCNKMDSHKIFQKAIKAGTIFQSTATGEYYKF